MAVQPTLLRFLEEQQFEPVGANRTVSVDVRVIAATNKHLEVEMEQGRFREDLFYRLNVIPVHLPPLRERREDIPLLVAHFVEKIGRSTERQVRGITPEALAVLETYHWPGNVRELENTIERAILVCEGGVIHDHHLPPTLQTAEASDTVTRQSLSESVEALERDLLQDALKTARGNAARAARLLATTERIFNYKAKRYGIDARRFRG